MRRRSGLVGLLRRVGEEAGTADGDTEICTFALAVIEARDERTVAAMVAKIDAALVALDAAIGEAP